jgi:tetratricopeptide (TPR) repeat protein
MFKKMRKNPKQRKNTISQIMDKVMPLISESMYESALDKLLSIERVLNETKETELIVYLVEWAYLYENKRHVLAEMGQVEQALQVCQEAIEKLTSVNDWAYLEAFKPVRQTLCSAYKMIAWNIYKNAEKKDDILNAVSVIDKCFETVSPIDESPLVPYYETKALIYSKAAKYDNIYDVEYANILKNILEEKVEVTTDEISEALVEVQKQDPLNQLRFGIQNETWEQAVERYMRAFSLDENPFEFNQATMPEEIAEAEQKSGFEYPDSLNQFCMLVGNGGGNCTHVNGLSLKDVNSYRGLLDTICFDWYEENENTKERWYDDWYGDTEAAAFINENYKVIGVYYFNEDNHYYFLLGKNKKMGVINFQQDDWSDLNLLLDEDLSILKYDNFEELMSRFFNVLINYNCFEGEEWNIWRFPAHELLEKGL